MTRVFIFRMGDIIQPQSIIRGSTSSSSGSVTTKPGFRGKRRVKPGESLDIAETEQFVVFEEFEAGGTVNINGELVIRD